MGHPRTVSSLPQLAITIPIPNLTKSPRTTRQKAWMIPSAKRRIGPDSLSRNSVMVMWSPRRAAEAPPRNDTQTIMNSQNSVVNATSLPMTCMITLKKTMMTMMAPTTTIVQSTAFPSQRINFGAGGAGGKRKWLIGNPFGGPPRQWVRPSGFVCE